MAEIPVGFAQVNWLFGGTGYPTGAETTIGVAYDGVVDVDIAAATCFDAFADNVMPELMSSCILIGCLFKAGPTQTGPSAVFSGSVAGTSGATALPPNTSYLVQKNTAAGGRAGRGRMYIPSVAEAAADNAGVIASGTVTALTNAMAGLLTDLVTADFNPHLLHGAGAPLTVPTEITSLTVSSRVATQRRRLRR